MDAPPKAADKQDAPAESLLIDTLTTLADRLPV
jgi:hypothetical protein